MPLINQTLVSVFTNVAMPYDVKVLVADVELPARYILTSTCLDTEILPEPLLMITTVVPVVNATLALLGTVIVVGAVVLA